MIIVTGGAGFIGSALVWKLNQEGHDDTLVVDRMGTGNKWKNLAKRRFSTVAYKDSFFDWLETEGPRHAIDAVVHLGACSSTTEADVDYLMANNLNYSMRLWRWCVENSTPFIYASSAATYGGGELGFSDAPELTPRLVALNAYGFSKQKFDDWVLRQARTPPYWAGLRFFNVYGPQEYHKGFQASVVWHFTPQAKQTGAIKLFKSEKKGCADGEQKRDFVYVKDCVNVISHLLKAGPRGKAESRIYNLGSGAARSYNELARAIFKALGKFDGKLEYIDMPASLKAQYQYFTEADLSTLRTKGGYTAPMTTLEAGVDDYVRTYLSADDQYL